MKSRQRSTTTHRSQRARHPNAERPNPYRFSPGFIRRMTVILCIAIVVLPAAGFIYGATLGPDYTDSQSNLALGLIGGGFGVPLIAASILGGEAIRRGGGFVGFLFAAGLIGGPTGSVFGIPWLAIVGYAALGLSVILFFVIGFMSKVPMWIGTPGAKVMSWNDPDDPDTINT